ncbi:Rpn family recombination-promoting nuclease/putative transposase [Ileibacterium valens]|uniref:Uncharacterized protein n=2 Tax=Ileibacterium valens TaxID=1862668 RepID=A0A1U7NH78_9FIRM|nr:Rpn family recombination-promoting nuclease/putative transposase [Ileibacterium valens]OLU40886.1 hypothetical protein BO222_04160 [Ileibacterium valens]OLU42611.1 hypothetical protein BO224_01685 [Erysipelotrichaceae bacterium NYU-BL-E8]OLU42822.1 hypothetical protein BM735_01575 [Erysipelotrichaceae bacterium NYU-BL-F16]
MKQKNKKNIARAAKTTSSASPASVMENRITLKLEPKDSKLDGKIKVKNKSVQTKHLTGAPKGNPRKTGKQKNGHSKTGLRNKPTDKALDGFYQNKVRAADLFETALKDQIGPLNPKQLRLSNPNQKHLGKDAKTDVDRSNVLLFEYQDKSGTKVLITLILENQKYCDGDMLERLLDSSYVQVKRWFARVKAKPKARPPEKLPGIYTVVFFHGDSRWSESISLDEVSEAQTSGDIRFGYHVLEPKDLKEFCKDPDNHDLGVLLCLLHELERKTNTKQNRSESECDIESLITKFDHLMLTASEDVIKVVSAEAGVPDKFEDWIERKRQMEQKAEEDKMSFLKEYYENLDKKIKRL